MVKSVNNTTKSIIHSESSPPPTKTGKLPGQQQVAKKELQAVKKIQKSLDTRKIFLEDQQRRAEQRYRATKAEQRIIPDNILTLPNEMRKEIVSSLVNRCTPETLIKTLGDLVEAVPSLAPLADELGAKYIEKHAIPISSLGFTSIKSMVSFATKLGSHLKYFDINLPRQLSSEDTGDCLEDSDIQKLVAACPNLETIKLHFVSVCHLSDNSLIAISQLQNLEKLTTVWIKGNHFTDTGLSHLSQSQSLKELDIHNSSNITNQGLLFLGQLSELKSFGIAGNENITDQGLSYLSTHPYLESLSFIRCKLNRDSGFSFGELTKLKHLELFYCNLDDEVMRQLSQLTELESLNIAYNPSITNHAMPYLSEMTQLNKLNVVNTGLNTKDFVFGKELLTFLKTGDRLNNDVNCSLADLGFHTTRSAIAFAKKLGEKLENFHLSYSSEGATTDQDIEDLVTSCPNLKLIIIRNPNNLSNKSLKLISSLQHLEALYIFQNNILTDAGLKELRRCNTLQEFGVTSELISDEGLSYLSQIPELQRLVLGNLDLITDMGIWFLTALQKLVMLDITGCSQVTKSSVRNIAKMNLRELDCDETGLAPGIHHVLQDYKDGGILERLADYGFDKISGIEFAKSIGPNLTILDLDGLVNVSDKDIEKLVEACPNLQRINVTHSDKITSRSVEKLATLKNLVFVSFANCPSIVTEEVTVFHRPIQFTVSYSA